ncbi:MAG: DUF499 domain-containing protein [Bacteroides sp.]|nr:DUF499 domain-containing protein [Bacteroides sp.]
MNDQIHKALGIFLDAMRPFVVSLLQQHFPHEPWEGVYYSKLNPDKQAIWNQAIRAQGENPSCMNLIDYYNLQNFAINFKRELEQEFGTIKEANKFISYLQELQETRNKCSHYQVLDEDEIERTFSNLKLAARLLKMKELIVEIENIKKQHKISSHQHRGVAPEVTPKNITFTEDSPIPAWFTNVYPHYDIRNGVLDESVFAANLSEVALGTGQEVYSNPTIFFEKTYITAGLRDISNRVIRALNGEETDNRVISLQTGFGDGKTHTLISLYHIAKAGRSFMNSVYHQQILNQGVMPQFDNAKVAVFTNNTTDVVQGRQTDDLITIRTLWGELAYQLGGKEGYNRIRENDESLTAPTASLIKPILEQAAPALLLIDELADYCNKATAKKVESGSLYTQTISFVQTLTEVVSSIPRCLLISTLPASATEVASSETGQQILSSLETRIIRVGTSIKPVDDEEIFEVVRRRLFENVENPEVIEQVLTRYKNTYHNRYRDLPDYADRMDYINKMRKSYPFHPELIDMFRLKWGNDSRFQRTRGVLRLLASIVKDLWMRRGALTGSQALIHTSDVNLANLHTLTAQITSLMGSQWETVMHADVIGTSSNAYKIDNEDPGSNIAKYNLTQGIATTLLMSSIGDLQNKGLNIEQLKLCMLRPNAFNHSEINNALNKLEQVAFYLYSTNVGTRNYWFQAKPNINILVNKAKSDVNKEDIKAEILKRLHTQTHSTSQLRILINHSEDVPEQKSLTLVILGPDYATQANPINGKVKTYIKQIATKKGNTQRIYRNTIFYLTCSETNLGILQTKLLEYLACKKAQEEYNGQLDSEQRKDILARKTESDNQANEQLIAIYNVVLRHSATEGIETIEVRHFANDFNTQITKNVIDSIMEEEWLIKTIGAGTLKSNHLYPSVESPVNVTALYEAFLQYDDKPMISGIEAVTSCIQKYCYNGEFNVAFGEEGNYTRIYHNENIFDLNVTDKQYWLVDKTVVLQPESGNPTSTPPQPLNVPDKDNVAHPKNPESDTQDTVRKFRSIKISGKIPMDQWTHMFPSFIIPLKNNGLEIEISFKAKSTSLKPLDESAHIYKVVKESAQQLGLNLEEEVQENTN